MANTLLLRVILAAIGTVVLFAALIFLPFAGLPMAAIGLAFGLTQAALVALVAIGLLWLLLAPSLAIAFGFLFAAPILVTLRQALLSRQNEDGSFAFYPIDRLILLVVAMCSIGSVLIFLFMGGEAGLPQAFADALSSSPEIRQVLGQMHSLSSPEDVLRVANIMLITGFASWPLIVIGNLQIAQAILVKTQLNLRPAADYELLQLPQGLSLILGILLVTASFTHGAIATLFGTLAGIIVSAYFLLGLAIIHAISRHWNARGFFLAGLYFLIFMMAWVIIPVSLMGLLDARFDFRKLKQRPDKPSDETRDKE